MTDGRRFGPVLDSFEKKSAMVSQSKRGFLLVGHGTRDDQGIAEFLATSRLVARQIPHEVQPCFLELSKPTIDDGVARLASRGVENVTVVPLMLFAAGHVNRDIPDAVEKAAAMHRQLNIDHTTHLGCHRCLIELSAQRFHETIHPSYIPEETLWLLVGRGSSDPNVEAEMEYFVEHRRQATPVGDAQPCFLAMAKPSLNDILAKSCESDFSRIVVQPHLLFHGEMLQQIRRQVQAVARDRPKIEWLVTEHLGACQLLADTVIDRCRDKGNSPISRA